ncbi:MAG: ATP-binding cassette domain-containing protein [Chloroflexota bacterium]|nr:ATP-binding cassette domain-containing protein [Chloroflexota bacterium]
MFVLRGVSVRRAGVPLLSDVNLSIEAGERWVVLGPNGAGKTTLMRILSTYLVPSAGTVDVLGQRLGRTNVADLRPRIGYLSPSLAHEIPEQLTPRQVVDAAQAGALFPWYVAPERMSRERTNAALAQVGLADVPERPFATFSSGEQLRIQLARALVTDPAALLLDEPMASLDIGGREALLASLERIGAGPIGAMVLVVHRLEDVPSAGTHAALLRDGRVVAAGPVDEVLRDELMSACFGAPIRVAKSDGGRWTVR